MPYRATPPHGDWPAHFHHLPVDFLGGGAEGIAKVLREHDVKPDAVFFYAYIQPPPQEGGSLWSDVDVMFTVNSKTSNQALIRAQGASWHRVSNGGINFHSEPAQ